MTYLSRLPCTAEAARSAILVEDLFADREDTLSLVANETPDGWELLLYTNGPPDEEILGILQRLSNDRSAGITTEELKEEDWVTRSQAGLEPVDIGPFHIHTRETSGRAAPGQWPIRIDAGLAFGTGQHATTSGCVHAAIALSEQTHAHNILDIGTGSGVLTFVARRLWPSARLTATDIDPIATGVARTNAVLNRCPPGDGRGKALFFTADGIGHPLLRRRAPYDLILANILAGPLLKMSAGISALLAPEGHLILSGLLAGQADAIVRGYRLRGLKPVSSTGGEWPTLTFRKTRREKTRRASRPQSPLAIASHASSSSI